VAAGAAAVAGQDAFGDVRHAGMASDARRDPSDLGTGGHVLEPFPFLTVLDAVTPHVYGDLTAGWTDNLLQDDRDEPGVRLVDTFYGRASAGLRLDIEPAPERLRAELGYEATVTEYAASGRFDTFTQAATARLDVFFTDVDLHADARYARSSYPNSIQLRGIIDVDDFAAGAWAEARVGDRFGGRLSASLSGLEFREGALRDLDHLQWVVSAQAYGRVLPKVRITLDYSVTFVNFDEGDDGSLNDYTVHTVQGGVDGELTPKLSGSVKLGASFQDVDQSGPNPDDREFTGFTAGLALRWEVLVNTTIEAGYTRSVQVSFTSNFLETDDVSLAVTQTFYEGTVRLRLEGGWTRSHVSPGDNLNVLRGAAAVTWQVRDWLSLRAGYELRKLNSGFPNDDYLVNTATVGIGAGF